MCDRTTKTEIPEASAQEDALMDAVIQQYLPAYLDAAGYPTETKTVSWEESTAYQEYQKKRNDLIAQIEDKKRNYIPGAAPMGMTPWSGLQRQLEALDSKAAEQSKEYPITEYETHERESYAAEEARKKYGVDSPEYQAEHQKWLDQKIATEESTAELTSAFQAAATKYLNGDFSITADQKALISERLAPVRAAVTDMFKDTEEKTIAAYDSFKSEIAKTKLSVSDALDAVGSQIIATGKKMEESLKEVVSTNQQLLKIGITDYSGELTKKVAADATSQGRSPDDPEYTKSIADSVGKLIKEGTLNLASMQAQGQLSIDERTGSKLEALGMSKADVEQNFGLMTAGAEKEKGLAVADLAAGKGQAMVGLAQEETNQQWNVGAGMVPGQIQVGQSVAQFNDAILRSRMANAGAAMSGVMGPVQSYYLPQRMAQPTTTQQANPWDWISGALGVASAGAGIYSAANMGSMMRGPAASGFRGGESGGFIMPNGPSWYR